MSITQLRSTSLDSRSTDEQTASILIVDDEKALRIVLCRAIQKEGYDTIDANSGERCLFLCQQQLPDVILLDAVMPGMDGFECCQKLQQMLGDRCPPVLIITALYDQESVDRAFAVGVADFITKPIHWAVLRQRVQQVLKTRQMTRQWQASLRREQRLQDQLTAATRRVDDLTEVCRSHGIDTSL